MRRMLTRTGLLIALVAALTGCIKVDEDLTVRKDGKVDGTAIVAFSKDFVSMIDSLGNSMGSSSGSGSATTKKQKSFEEQLRNPDPIKGLPAGATAKSTFYKQGDWIGSKITFKGVPADKLKDLDTTASAASGGSSSDGQDFSLTKEGGNWHFRMVMDMSSAGAGLGETTTTVKGQKPAKGVTTTSPLDMSAMFGAIKAEMRIKVTFPGKVIKSNGKVSGNSVTWTPAFGKKVIMDAVAKG